MHAYDMCAHMSRNLVLRLGNVVTILREPTRKKESPMPWGWRGQNPSEDLDKGVRLRLPSPVERKRQEGTRKHHR